jgi:hypothetical protein
VDFVFRWLVGDTVDNMYLDGTEVVLWTVYLDGT